MSMITVISISMLTGSGESRMKRTIGWLLSLCVLLLFFTTVQAGEEETWAKSYALEAKGEYKEAAAVIEPFLNGGGDTAEFALLRYGWLNYLLRNHNDAIRSYEKALRLNPNSIDARLGLTLPLLVQQRWKEAARYAKQVLQRSPWNFTAHLRLLVSEEGRRKWSVMKKHASELAARYPSSATPWVYLARAEAWLGDHEAAKRAYVRVLRRIPAHLEANAYLNKGKEKE